MSGLSIATHFFISIMGEFQTINEVIAKSVETSSYNTVIISSCVFIVYTLIIKIIDVIKQKSKNKPIQDMATAIKDVSNNVVLLNTVLSKTIQDNEKKESAKLRSVITLVFNSFQATIAQKAIDVIIHNHIETNKEFIVENITKLVNTEYYKVYSILSNYEINNCIVSSKLKEDWIKECVDDILMIIYNQQDSITRISQINNKLSINVNEYSTYLLNKTFN
ncbi:MAG: hypothetical protein MJ209_00075 [archaeon]|nr:hypothetical protein [archaeon]